MRRLLIALVILRRRYDLGKAKKSWRGNKTEPTTPRAKIRGNATITGRKINTWRELLYAISQLSIVPG